MALGRTKSSLCACPLDLQSQSGVAIFKFFQKSGFTKKSYPILWLLPFLAFAGGYILAESFLHKTDVATPNVIGKLLHEAVQTLSKHHLGLRLLHQRPDATLPEGTILDQLPRPEQKIRPNQHVFITISTRQRPVQAPDCWGKKDKEVMELVTKNGLEPQIMHLATAYPAGMCVAQFPSAGHELDNNKMVLYVSAGKQQVSIMPNVRGCLLNEVQDALRKHDIRAEIFHARTPSSDHDCSTCKIIDQQPVPGSIIDMARGLQFQLRVADW